jgi:sulfite reductase (NADPH) hemoprotein beta-component
MYVHDEFDRTLIAERVEEFRDQVRRRLSGELSEDEFKLLRLLNGVYLQLHAYMLRIAIPYGTLSSAQLRMLAHVARRYDRGYGHFTTRQNIQFHWIKLAELPDAMADLARVGLHGMQTSGNSVRNITTDQWAGVAPDEIEDPRLWAEVVRQHVTLHPEFTFMPRKFKIAVGAAAHDRVALRIHDLALRLHRNAAGETGFEVMVGGGLGRTPFLAKTIKQFLPTRDVLSYVEAVLRVYNQYGRRDNIYKARIKILVHELGAEAFAREVEQEWRSIRDGALALEPAAVTEIAARFRYPAYERLADNPIDSRAPDRPPSTPGWQFGRHTRCQPCHRDAVAQAEGGRPAMPPRTRWTRSPISPTIFVRRDQCRPRAELLLPMSRRSFRGCGGRSTRSASPRRIGWSPTSSLARGSTTAASPMPAPYRSPRS